MADLRLVPSPARPIGPDEACLAAYQRELEYIHRSLRRLGTPASEVDDLAQEVFLALRRAWPDYDAQRPLRPYLFGIAFRVSAASHRKTRREVALGVVELGDSEPGPLEALQSKQARALVLAALETIPLPRRAVLIMHEIDGVPVEEVAAILGIPKFTAYSRLRKGRKEMESAARRLMREAKTR
jgi:RNA polymerase sigma-70 factor (ECF subfamily)